MSITDLMKVRQRNQEAVQDYIQRFRDVRSRCFKLKLDDSQLTAITFEGLLPHIKEKYSAQEFDSLSHMVQRMANIDVRFFDQRNRPYTKKVANVGFDADSDEEQEVEIGLAEWVKTKKPTSVPFAKKDPENFSFDITKADKIFDLLLQAGQLKLTDNHVVPSAPELKKAEVL